MTYRSSSPKHTIVAVKRADAAAIERLKLLCADRYDAVVCAPTTEAVEAAMDRYVDGLEALRDAIRGGEVTAELLACLAEAEAA
jgi:hypothetical protein